MSKRAKIIIALIVITLTFLAAFVLVYGDRKTQNTPVTIRSPVKVNIIDDSSLRDLLLDRQVPVVEQGISDYIRTTIGNSVNNVSIVSKPTVASNGLIEFTIETDNPKKQFKIALDRTTYFDRIILSVPDDNYSKILPVYQTRTGD